MKLSKLKRSIAAVMAAAAMCVTQFGITAFAADTGYTVTVTTEGSGTAYSDPAVQTPNGKVTLTAVPDAGFEFDHWDIVSPNTTQGDKVYTKTASVVFIVDTTGSMSNDIKKVKNNLINLVQSLDSKGIGLNMSIIAYSDVKTYEGSTVYYTFADGTHWTTDVNEAVKIFDSIKTGKGSKETPTDAFTQLVTSDGSLNFPAGSINNYIFLLTDEDYYELNDSSKNRYPMATWVEKFTDAKVKVSVVTTTQEYKKETYKDLFEKTGGMYIDIASKDYGKLMEEFSNYLDKTSETSVTYSETSYSNPATFDMPECNITAKAVFKTAAKSTHTISVITNGHGRAYANKSSAYSGETVNITAVPESGYVIDTIRCTSGGAFLNGNSFIMPDADVVISVTFKEDTSKYVYSAHPFSYVFSYDSDMTLIGTNANRGFDSYPEYVAVKIDLGADYAGKTGTIRAGRKPGSNVIETVTLDENGCYVFKAGISKNYSFVLD